MAEVLGSFKNDGDSPPLCLQHVQLSSAIKTPLKMDLFLDTECFTETASDQTISIVFALWIKNNRRYF